MNYLSGLLGRGWNATRLPPDPDSVKIPAGLVDLLARLSQRLNEALALSDRRKNNYLDANISKDIKRY